MGIVVTRGTTHVGEMERQDFIRPASGAHFMTIGARHSPMCAGQRKPRVAMLGDGEGRAVEIHNCVAVFASVLVRRSGKLAVMRVFVTIRTGREFHFVNSVFASREMALPTFNRNVLASQRIA